MADRAGEQLGNYRLLKLIGRGGFADVYLGEHVRLGNQVAIKVLQTRLETEDIEAFQREARTIGRLSHPNIVRVYDFAVQDGVPFLAMDYAPNGTLRQRYTKGVQVPIETILETVRQVADALQYAHEQKVVHRDVKPENMLVGPLNDILLSDFGIAVVSQSSRYQTSNEMVGTVGYMSPEQIQGHPHPASDQYALGIVVYEWLCGARPFSGGVTEVATQQLVLPPPSLRAKVPALPPALEDVVMTALAKDPAQRFASVRAFAAALENVARANPSIHLAATQLSSGLVLPPLAPPATVDTPPQPSGPSGGSGAQGSFPPPPAGGLPSGPSQTWSDAATVRGSQPVEANPYGSSPPGYGSAQLIGAPPAPPSGGYNTPPASPSEFIGGPPAPPSGFYNTPPASPSGTYGASPTSWSYGAQGSAQLVPPPPPGMAPSGVFQPPSAPGGSAPTRARRGPALWIVLALVALLVVGAGGAAAFAFLGAHHPTIQVTSSYAGAKLGGPPDTVLHVTGQHFASASSITFLLDGQLAPGAQLAQSDAAGNLTASLTITDDWTFETHTLTAKDAQGDLTQSGVSITVVPQPVLHITSDYHSGSVPVGSVGTSFSISGKRFAPNALVTFLLDGKPLADTQPTPDNAKGQVQTTLIVTSALSLGTHTLTAQDNQGNSTQQAASLDVVHQGEAGTPGPDGAPADDAAFSIAVTVHVSGGSSYTITLNVSNGKVCDNGNDTGQPQNYKYTYSDGTSYTETYIWTCSGTYKAGHLTYTETDTKDTFQLSDGGYCVAATPRVQTMLDGTFSNSIDIAGSYKSDATQISCPTVKTFYLQSSGPQSGTWSGSVN